ncbi:MAG: FliM/FliN family flagellar motor switch protein [Chthoniobacterales bacterium]
MSEEPIAVVIEEIEGNSVPLAEDDFLSSKEREKEVPLAPAIPVQPALEVELRFLLDRKRMPLTEIRSLAEGKIITLGCSEFQASVMLQEKIIAQAELVLVDGRPSLQITKVFSGV